MLHVGCVLRRAASAVAPGSLRALQKKLRHLRRSSGAATAVLQERRRLRALLLLRARQAHRNAANSSTASSSSLQDDAGLQALHDEALRYLPQNSQLTSAMALTLHTQRDARAELEFTRHLVTSTLLSLAVPVAPWDPYDVRPQVFAFDNCLALPVFTSLEYLQLFCARFGFVVHDPSGVLWADGRRGSGRGARDDVTALLAESVATSAAWQRLAGPTLVSSSATPAAAHEPAGNTPDDATATALPLSADDLFDDMAPNTSAGADSVADTRRTPRRRRKTRRAASRTRRRGAAATRKDYSNNSSNASKAGDESETAQRSEVRERASELLRRLASVQPLNVRQATPLPVLGSTGQPYFAGYFADIHTLLHNAAIVPDKVDLVVNPCSAIELVLAREMTDRVLAHDQLLLTAYQNVEKELQREFGEFFAAHCPEVVRAYSACVPLPLQDRGPAREAVTEEDTTQPLRRYRGATRVLRESQFSNGVRYALAIALESEALPRTYRQMQWAKQRCVLLGHSELDVVPMALAAPHVRDAARLFYDRDTTRQRARWAATLDADHGTADGAHAKPGGPSSSSMGVFHRLGATQTISVTQSAESFYHDPTNAYTEPHAVFTEYLKVEKGQ